MADAPIKQKKALDYIPVIFVSGNRKADIMSIWKLASLPYAIQKGAIPITVSNPGIARSRSLVIRRLKEVFEQNGVQHDGYCRALWFDDDIILDDNLDVKQLGNWILEADRNNWNITANYRGLFKKTAEYHTEEVNTLMHRINENEIKFYTDDEILAMKAFDPLPNTVTGLGFYYGYTPLDYKFRIAGNHDQESEDIYFFEDNKIDLRYIPAQLWHEKKAYIGLKLNENITPPQK